MYNPYDKDDEQLEMFQYDDKGAVGNYVVACLAAAVLIAVTVVWLRGWL